MSERNGDKARFGRERKRKILRRKRVREFQSEHEQGTSARKSSGPQAEK